MIKFLCILFLFPSIVYGVVRPSSHKGTESSFEARIFKKLQYLELVGELKYRFELENNDYKQQALGFYRRENSYIKWGLFLWREEGVITDFDWAKKDVDWGWRDVQNRGVYSAVADLTLNYLFENFDLLFEFKNRYFNNFSRGLEQLRMRPGLTKFFRSDDKIKYSVFFQYEVYLPMNYGQGGIYERWSYLGGLVHFSNISFGPYISYRVRHWKNSDEFNQKTGQSFKVSHNSVVLGLVANFYF